MRVSALPRLLVVMACACALGSRCLLPNLVAVAGVVAWLASLVFVLLSGIACFCLLLFDSLPLTAWLLLLNAALAVCALAGVASSWLLALVGVALCFCNSCCFFTLPLGLLSPRLLSLLVWCLLAVFLVA